MESQKLKLNSHELRKSAVGKSAKKQKEITRNPVVIVLDNVLDTYNIGSFFRLADAVSAEKLILCGPVVTPPNLKIHRASIGTWKWVPWVHYDSTLDAVKDLKSQGYHIAAIEQASNSVDYLKAEYDYPLAIIAGSESNGVGDEVLKIVDKVIELPMYGVNVSLNVLVATSIVIYHALTKIKK
ncbi:MAG TPA: TrmH family RNA methyltransferase [Patescibacteria group bacterium]